MAKVTFVNPIFNDITDLVTAGEISGTRPATSSPIAWRDANAQTPTAWNFCQQFGYSLDSYFLSNTDSNPTATFEAGLWRIRGGEKPFLQITCEDNSVSPITVNTQIENVGDMIFLQGVMVTVLIALLVHQVFGKT